MDNNRKMSKQEALEELRRRRMAACEESGSTERSFSAMSSWSIICVSPDRVEAATDTSENNKPSFQLE